MIFITWEMETKRRINRPAFWLPFSKWWILIDICLVFVDNMRNHFDSKCSSLFKWAFFVSTLTPIYVHSTVAAKKNQWKRSFKQITLIFHSLCCDRSRFFSVSSISRIKRLVVHLRDILKFDHIAAQYLCIYTWMHITMLCTANRFSWFAFVLLFSPFKNVKNKC